MNQDELKEALKNDPFIELWKNNYDMNIELGHLSLQKSKPILFIQNTKPYQEMPVVLIVAGPSLDKNIEELKGYKDNCIIVCADVVLFKLVEHEIKPDFVVNVDPHESITRFFEKFDTSDIALVCPVTTNPKTIQSWKGNIFYYVQSDVPGFPKGEALKRINRNIKSWGTLFNRFFVGASMLQFASMLNPSMILLVGYDFAYTDDKPYCDGFLDVKLVHLEDPVGSPAHTAMIEKLKLTEMKKELEIQVSPMKSIWTSQTLNFYKKTFIDLLRVTKFPVINSTEGGILIEIDKMPLKSSLAAHCSKPIKRIDNIMDCRRKKRKRR